MAEGKKGVSLSAASPYEQLFKTRYRRVGRPADAEPVFNAPDADPFMVAVAKRRAFAVVHEENKDRLSEVFEREMRVLNRRGLEQVASDTGRRIRDESESPLHAAQRRNAQTAWSGTGGGNLPGDIVSVDLQDGA